MMLRFATGRRHDGGVVRVEKRRLRRRVAVLTTAALLVLGACSGDDSGNDDAQPISPKWDAAAVQQVEARAAQIAAAAPGECADFGLYPRVGYIQIGTPIGRKVPLAVGNCQAFGNDVEITEFSSSAKRAEFVRTLTASICRNASARKETRTFPGLFFVEGDTWAAQPDGEPVGRRLEAILGGEYRLVPCKNGATATWNVQDAEEVEGLAADLGRADLGCTDLVFEDHDRLLRLPPYQPETGGLPAAVAKCTITGTESGATQLVVFADEAARDQYLPVETAERCELGRRGLVVGEDWAVFLPVPDPGPAVAAALGGEVREVTCP
jgi:hypothetical protein